MRRKFISIILTIWVLLMMPITAFAQSFDADYLGSISVTLMNQDGKTPFYSGLVSIVINAALCAMLLKPMGIGGLALAAAVSSTASAATRKPPACPVLTQRR